MMSWEGAPPGGSLQRAHAEQSTGALTGPKGKYGIGSGELGVPGVFVKDECRVTQIPALAGETRTAFGPGERADCKSYATRINMSTQGERR